MTKEQENLIEKAEKIVGLIGVLKRIDKTDEDYQLDTIPKLIAIKEKELEYIIRKLVSTFEEERK